MSTNLMEAHRQWATRPEDERFANLELLQDYVDNRFQNTETFLQNYRSLRVIPRDDRDDIYLATGEDQLLNPTHWSFGQMATRIGAPAGFMAKLPAPLVADNLNHCLQTTDDGLALIHRQDHGEGHKATVRAFTSERYGQIPDSKIVQWLRNLCTTGTWKQPLANPRGEYGRPRENAQPGGLYASDRDMFAFLIDEDKVIEVGDEQLARGFFIWNSEVGYKSFGMKLFLYRFVCGNNIVWGAENVFQLSTRHVGENAEIRALGYFQRALDTFANQSTDEQTEFIKKAMEYQIPDKGDTIKVMKWIQRRGFTKKQAKECIEYAILEEGACDTLWHVIQGLSAVARDMEHMDMRTQLETQTSQLFRLAA